MKRKVKLICNCGHVEKDHMGMNYKLIYCRECGIDMSDLNTTLDPVCAKFMPDSLRLLEHLSGGL